MVLRFLGESVTDSNGNAVLEDGYTCTGAGLVDIIAQTTIDESTVVSQPYEVLDFKYVDKAIDGQSSNIWSNTSYFNRQADGTVFSNPSATGWTSVYFKPNNSQNIPLSSGLTFEFDIVAITVDASNQFRVRFIDNGTNPYYSLTETGHYKFVLSDKLYGYKDGVALGGGVTYDTSISTLQAGIVDTGASASVKFKNFGYY